MTRPAVSGKSPRDTDRYGACDAPAGRAPRSRGYSACWDDAARVVRFSMAGGALRAAITRDALEMLAGAHLPASSDALREFRRHRMWIETLATSMMEERCDLAVVLTQADICFQLACEAEMLVQALCV